jgi:hypothetical protein
VAREKKEGRKKKGKGEKHEAVLFRNVSHALAFPGRNSALQITSEGRESVARSSILPKQSACDNHVVYDMIHAAGRVLTGES